MILLYHGSQACLLLAYHGQQWSETCCLEQPFSKYKPKGSDVRDQSHPKTSSKIQPTSLFLAMFGWLAD